jgi:hypothetical protein
MFVAAALSLLVTRPALAEEFIVDVRGTSGTPYRGKCTLLIGRGRNQTAQFEGIVPKGHKYTAPAINCTVRRKSGRGELEVRLWQGDDVVAKIETNSDESWVNVWSTGLGRQFGSHKGR